MTSGARKKYNKYFDGFSEVEVENSKGMIVIKRVYTGTYHCADITDEQWKRDKLFYTLAYVLAAAGLIIGGMLDSKANCNKVTMGGNAAALVLFLVSADCFISKLASNRKMIKRVYRDSAVRLANNSKYLTIALLFAALSELCFMVILRDFSQNAVLSLVLYIVSGALIYLVYRRECSIHYKEIENENEPVPDAVEITY